MLQDVVNKSCPLPRNSKVLIFGGGYSGLHLKKALKELGVTAFSSKRNPSREADFIFDSEKNINPSQSLLKGTTHVISCIPPSIDGTDPVLKLLKQQLNMIKPIWVGYLSTTGVYGDSGGNWVNEETLPNPTLERSKRRLNCENEWLNSGLPAHILRLPGIYGPDRSSLDSILKGQIKLVFKPKQVFSRIHVDDIVGASIYLMNSALRSVIPKVVNIADNLPSSNIEVMRYASQLINIELPEPEDFSVACKNMSPMALSFWKENRKVSNKLLCGKLKYELIHPTYEKGLKDCLNYQNY